MEAYSKEEEEFLTASERSIMYAVQDSTATLVMATQIIEREPDMDHAQMCQYFKAQADELK